MNQTQREKAAEFFYVCPDTYCPMTSKGPRTCSGGDRGYGAGGWHSHPPVEMVEYRRADGGGQACYICNRVRRGDEAPWRVFDPSAGNRYANPWDSRYLCLDHWDYADRVADRIAERENAGKGIE